MSGIDYAAQFKLIDYTTADEMTAGWKRHRVYTDARKAFQSAARTEARGIDVAFATTGFGQYHVWAEQREMIHVCFTDDTYCDECGGEVVETTYHAEDSNGVGLVYRDWDGAGTLVGTYSTMPEAERVAAYLTAGGSEIRQTPASLWVAEADSRHFSFTCTGFSEDEAREAMWRGLQAHADQYGLDPDWYGDRGDINVHEVPIGTVLRDGVGIDIV